MNPKFDYYEVVKVKVGSNLDISDKEGAVLGMAQTDDGFWIYSIQLLDDDGWDLKEDQLISTGKKMRREDFYDGDNIIVYPK